MKSDGNTDSVEFFIIESGEGNIQDQAVLYVTEGTAKMEVHSEMHNVMSPESMDCVQSPEILDGSDILHEHHHVPMEFRVQFVNGKMENYSSPELMCRFRKDDTDKLMKILKDAASRPMDETGFVESVDVDQLVQEDLNRMQVKKLRTLIPKLLILCYFSPEEISGKRKMKHVWEKKPDDWPYDVPFKDPNNGGSDKHKPGKTELLKMAMFLKEKYLKDVKKCVAQPVNDERQPTMETTSNASALTGLSSPEGYDLMPTEALLERLRKKMVHLVWGFSREKPEHMKMLQRAYSVVYEHYQNSRSSSQHKFMFLDSGHWFENIADQLLLGREFSDRELEGRLMAIYGIHEDPSDNMSNHTSQESTQVMANWMHSLKTPLMDGNYYSSRIKEEPPSPKSGFTLPEKELPNFLSKQPLDAQQLNIQMRGGAPFEHLVSGGNIQARQPPPPELTYKIPDKILRYDTNGQPMMELADTEESVTPKPWYNMKTQMEPPVGQIPSSMPAETVFPTSTPSDCAMEGTLPISSPQSTHSTTPSSGGTMTVAQESLAKNPPSYYDHLMTQNRPHQLAVSGQSQNYPGYIGADTGVAAVSQPSVNHLEAAIVTSAQLDVSTSVPVTSSTSFNLGLAQSSLQRDTSPLSIQEKALSPETPSGEQFTCQRFREKYSFSNQARGAVTAVQPNPDEWEDIMSVLTSDVIETSQGSSHSPSIVPKLEQSRSPECSQLPLSDTMSAAFNTLNNSGSLSQNESETAMQTTGIPVTVSDYTESADPLASSTDSRKKRLKGPAMHDVMGIKKMRR